MGLRDSLVDSTPTDHEIRIERIFDAPRDRVWQAMTDPELVARFEWNGMPGHVAIETMTLEGLGGGRTKIVNVSLFHTAEERDGMLHSGMETGLNESYAALDGLLAR